MLGHVCGVWATYTRSRPPRADEVENYSAWHSPQPISRACSLGNRPRRPTRYCRASNPLGVIVGIIWGLVVFFSLSATHSAGPPRQSPEAWIASAIDAEFIRDAFCWSHVSFWPILGRGAMSDLSPQCAFKTDISGRLADFAEA